MPARVPCPHCHKPLCLDGKKANLVVSCPFCGANLMSVQPPASWQRRLQGAIELAVPFAGVLALVGLAVAISFREKPGRHQAPIQARAETPAALPAAATPPEQALPPVVRLAPEPQSADSPRPELDATVRPETPVGLQEAQEALAPLPGQPTPAAVAKLIQSLRSLDKQERARAAFLVGNYGNAAREAAPALSVLLRQDRSLDCATQASRALAKIGPAAIPYLVSGAQDPSASVRYRSVWALGIIGPDAVPAVETLTRALADEEPEVRALAAWALGEIGPAAKAAAVPLARALADPGAGLRHQAALALQKVGPAAVQALVELLKDRRVALREEAAHALYLLGPEAKEAVPALAEAVQDKEARVRVQTLAALAAVGKDARPASAAILGALEVQHLETQQRALSAILAIGADDMPGLLRKLRVLNRKVRWATPYVLQQFGPKTTDAIKPLIKGLQDDDALVRQLSAAALAQIGVEAKEAMPDLEKALLDPVPEVQTAAAIALASMDQTRKQAAVEALELGFRRARQAQADAQARLAILQAAIPPAPPHLQGLTAADLVPGGLRRRRLVNRAALTDVNFQINYARIVTTFINQAVPCVPDPEQGWRCIHPLLDPGQVDGPPPEAVPALVAVYNVVLPYEIGIT